MYDDKKIVNVIMINTTCKKNVQKPINIKKRQHFIDKSENR